ncbi:MAG TPA: nickel pincer cofactor biosynthesis protein LarC [Gemmatimonadaceae bacterium]|nr:nickel pincer cofactor biosynthesis protein LarC [Gemmatimonadaceae bacterium]
MTIAILDPFSGIAGDMTLGALVQCGLEAEWLRALPDRLGLDGVTVDVRQVVRADIACVKVDFDIPPQPHGRHLRHLREIIARPVVPERVRERADAAFTAITAAEAEVHGTTPERVHLHEVGAVDAILDVVGSIWGLELLGVDTVFCGTIALGDGTVRAAHGDLPVPAPATLKLLEGHAVRPGPEGSGELVTPTGAALVRVLSSGPPPRSYVPRRSGFGAGTKEFQGRANALRIVLADGAVNGGSSVEQVVQLAADIDDMDAEALAGAADALRAAGALDVVLVPVVMKKGRAGTRIEVLSSPVRALDLERLVLQVTTSLGVRSTVVTRRVLAREMRTVDVLGQTIRVKIATLPDGTRRAKPEYEDVAHGAMVTGRTVREIRDLARRASELAWSARGT